MLYTKEKKTLLCFNLNVLFHSIRFATKYELPLHKLAITTQIRYYYTNWLFLHKLLLLYKLVIPTQIGHYYTNWLLLHKFVIPTQIGSCYYTNCYYYINSLLLHKLAITTEVRYYCTLNESTNN